MSPSDQFRLCSCNFIVKFGNLSQTTYIDISTENLFYPSQRKDCKGQVLSCEKYSSRVCNPIARKIRNLGSLYSRNRQKVKLLSQLRQISVCSTRQREEARYANQFRCFSNDEKSPRKTLKLGQESLQISEKESSDNLDQLLNIDNLSERGLQVKVVLKVNSGNVLVSFTEAFLQGSGHFHLRPGRE